MVSDIPKIEAYDESKLESLQNCLGISISKKELLESAITSSKAREKNPHLELEDLDRLAFIGDSILYFIASEYVLRKFKDIDDKGKLHEEREKYKQDKNLERLVTLNKLDEFFWYEEKYQRQPPSNKWIELTATFMEAIVGAIYLDSKDINSARDFIESYIIEKINTILNLSNATFT